MGGNVFGPGVASRLPAAQYYRLAGQLTDTFANATMVNKPVLVPSYRSKQDFGDMDLLYTGESSCLAQTLASQHTVLGQSKNGAVSSFLLQLDNEVKFQIDFIFAAADEFAFSLNYYAYNDAGNLAGRVAHRIGLKLGHDSLRYVQRAPDNSSRVLKEHVLTRDWTRALEYLDLDASVHARGFDTVEEIFQFATASKYFDYRAVALDERNHTARIRDRKRKTYQLFLLWLHEQGMDSYRSDLPSKHAFLTQHLQAFPEFAADYAAAEQAYAKQCLLQRKFNGDIAARITKLAGQQLGAFISYFRANTSDDQLLEMSEQQVAAAIAVTFQQYKSAAK